MESNIYIPRPGKAVKNLLIINFAVFLVYAISSNFFNNYFIGNFFALTPNLVIKKYFFWQLFTYQFVHRQVFHILFNMLALWMFGSDLEEKWGYKKFLHFYLVCGTATGFIIFLFNLLLGTGHWATLGASGTIFSILMVYAIYWGNRTMVWLVFPIRVKYFVAIIAAISFLSMLSGEDPFVSHIAHLGGLLVGYLYLKVFKDSTVSSWDAGWVQKWKVYKKKKEWQNKEKERFDALDEEKKVDEILSKISRNGIKSLTRNEREILKKASERMNDGNIH